MGNSNFKRYVIVGSSFLTMIGKLVSENYFLNINMFLMKFLYFALFKI
jgi:hypothetical protein